MAKRLFTTALNNNRANRAEAIKRAKQHQEVLEAVRDDVAISSLVEELDRALRVVANGIKRKEKADAKRGVFSGLPSVTPVTVYLSSSFDYAPGAPRWEITVRGDMAYLSGFKDKYLQRALEAWLAIGLDAKHATEDDAAWHTRKYSFSWDFTASGAALAAGADSEVASTLARLGGVRVTAVLAAHIRNDSPTCRQEVITTEEVVERKQYRLICA